MKKIIHVVLLCFLCNAGLCQSNLPPPDFEDPNDPNPTDQPSVPIDSHLIALTISAIFLGLNVIWRKKRNTSN